MEKENYLKSNSKQMRAMRRMLKAAQKWQLACPKGESRHVDYSRSVETVEYDCIHLTKFVASALKYRFDYTIFKTHARVEINNECVDGDPEDALNTFMRL